MEQQAEGDMHKRRARRLVDQADGCDSHYCMWRIRNRRKRGEGLEGGRAARETGNTARRERIPELRETEEL
jgi:hypothetical protein